ncbi:MAG: hypothetical protein AMJ54_04680 [Deltaproteobacteria bacterium SG8_13]|nr:MAG: hypothetical protein AMJ54_04680 [Deltaproteobacteria bacterium SG8_13]
MWATVRIDGFGYTARLPFFLVLCKRAQTTLIYFLDRYHLFHTVFSNDLRMATPVAMHPLACRTV